MAQSLRRIKSRIKSIESTKKLTRAMEMISISKLRQTQNIFASFHFFAERTEDLLKRVLGSADGFNHPLTIPRKDIGKIAVCVISSDTGLCGMYNMNVLRATDQFLAKYPKDKIILITVGRKGMVYFKKRGYTIAESLIGSNGRYTHQVRDQLLKILMDSFVARTVDEVYLSYTLLHTATRGRVMVEKFLNLEFPAGKKEDYLAEPDINAVINEIIPAYLSNKVRLVLLNAFVAEHQARAVAMGEATHNAVELLDALVLLRNKIRQASITNEVIEIISSAEALRG